MDLVKTCKYTTNRPNPEGAHEKCIWEAKQLGGVQVSPMDSGKNPYNALQIGTKHYFGLQNNYPSTKQLLGNVFKTFQNGWILVEMLSVITVVLGFLMEFQLVFI